MNTICAGSPLCPKSRFADTERWPVRFFVGKRICRQGEGHRLPYQKRCSQIPVGRWMGSIGISSIHEEATVAPELLMEALGVEPAYVGKSQLDYLVEVKSEDTVKNLKPTINLIAKLPVRGVIVTSRSNSTKYDFISRFFSPAQGLDEDYVTGSAHCCLGPYWKRKLQKSDFTAYQASERGGILKVKVLDDNVLLSGKAVTLFEGNLLV